MVRNEAVKVTERLLADKRFVSAANRNYVYGYADCLAGMMDEMEMTPFPEDTVLTAEGFFDLADRYLNTQLPDGAGSWAGSSAIQMQHDLRRKCKKVFALQPDSVAGRLQGYLDADLGFMQRMGLFNPKGCIHAGQR